MDMELRKQRIQAGKCAVCGLCRKEHKFNFDKETGTTTTTTHQYDGGNFNDFKYAQ